MSKKNALPITYREYQFDDAFPFLLMQVTHAHTRMDFLHFHNCIEIALPVKGEMIWNLENKNQKLAAGDLCFLPPFFTHESLFPPQETQDVLCYYLFFNPETLLAPLYPNGLPKEFFWYKYAAFSEILPGALFPEEKKIVQNIIDAVTSNHPYKYPVVAGQVQQLMVLLYRRHVEASSIPDFSENTKPTPGQTARKKRIEQACYLLTSTEDTILNIALQTGFSSLASFNRVFGQMIGRSPQTFRNEKRTIHKTSIKHAPYRADT